MLMIEILILAAVIGAIVLIRSRKASGPALSGGAPVQTAGSARRVAAYLMAFAGIQAVLYAGAALTASGAGMVLLGSRTLLSDLRGQISFDLAALIVGFPVWLVAWTIAQRRIAGTSDERDAVERRLFLAALFASTAIVALLAAHDVLEWALTWPGLPAARRSPVDAIGAGARLLVYGAAWLWYAQLNRRERSSADEDSLHDLAIYLVAGFALVLLGNGLCGVVREVSGDLLAGGQLLLVSPWPQSAWTLGGPLAAWVIAGGVAWVAAWGYDSRRGGRHPLRVGYLYLVELVAVPLALGGATDVLYEVVRRLCGYRGSGLVDLPRDGSAYLLVGGVAWAYHWMILRGQSLPPGTAADSHRGGITWPRRPGLTLLALAGLAIAAPAWVSLIWLGLDAVLGTDLALTGGDWWRDRLSLGLAAGLVGTVAWLIPWAILQRAARRAPMGERTARARRRLLSIVAIAGALGSIGFTIATLWLLLRALLGEALDATTVSSMYQNGSAALVSAGLAVYHGLTLRHDLRLAPLPAGRPVRLIALVAPGTEDILARLRQITGLSIETAGYLDAGGFIPQDDLQALQDALSTLAAQGGGRALLILGPQGGTLYPYTAGPASRATARGTPGPVETAPKAPA